MELNNIGRWYIERIPSTFLAVPLGSLSTMGSSACSLVLRAVQIFIEVSYFNFYGILTSKIATSSHPQRQIFPSVKKQCWNKIPI